MYNTILFYFIRFVVILSYYHVYSWELNLEEVISFSLSTCNLDNFYFNDTIPASIPGSVHTDLIKHGIIYDDPYYRYEELNMSWIPLQCWRYTSTAFNLRYDDRKIIYDDALPLLLSFDHIDAPAVISINGIELGVAENAHRRHVYSIDAHHLKASSSGNILSIVFPSSLQYARDKAELYPYEVPATVNFNVWTEPSSRNFVRKAGSDFGWDWGPAFLSLGVRGHIKLYQPPDNIELQEIIIDQVIADDYQSATLNVYVFLTLYDAMMSYNQHHPIIQRFEVLIDNHLRDVVDEPLSCISSSPSSSMMMFPVCKVHLSSITIKDVKLWWPRGYGDAHLYSIEVRMQATTSHPPPSSQSIKHRVGIRSIELIQDSIPSPSSSSDVAPSSFYLKVNDVAVFVKGANMIPIDSFPARISSTDRFYMLHAAAAANMNMMRVWGGGVYQEDEFYELADELGMMIWQEVMLACALYPVNKHFLDEIRAEVLYQGIRLGSHASIMVWGGNNENEVALTWFDASVDNRDLYVSDYSMMYGGSIYPMLSYVYGADAFHQHKQLVWVDSSPSNGIISYDPYAKLWTTPSTSAAGDMHFYDYSCDCEDHSSYPNPRFISEFGFQGMPSYLSYQPVTVDEDRQVDSMLLSYRQRHENGNQQIQTQLERHYHLPISCDYKDDVHRSFDMYLYLVALQQAACYETAIHHWRRHRGTYHRSNIIEDNIIDDNHMMGILYWQLNDMWQGPSWSSMEYGGSWKPLLYTVKRSYAPLLLSLELTNTSSSYDMKLYIINDHLHEYDALIVDVSLIPWHDHHDEDIINIKTIYDVTISSSSSLMILDVILDHSIMQSCTIYTCYIKATAKLSSSPTSFGGDDVLLTSTKPLAYMKDVELASSPIITNNFISLSSHEVSFQVSTTSASPSLFFELRHDHDNVNHDDMMVNQHAGWFSDNNFLAEANIIYDITYTSYMDEIVDVHLFAAQLQTRFLQSAYNCNISL